MKKRLSALILCLLMLLPNIAYAASCAELRDALAGTAGYVRSITPSPSVGAVGGEWGVIGIARGGLNVENSYYDRYYGSVCSYISERGGVLSTNKYTEYSRVVLALTAIGKDPRNVGGYDLVKPLYDTARVSAQGLNGPVWALIALDSGGYAAGDVIRDVYIRAILDRQLNDGGWALSKNTETSEADMTAMALIALSSCRGIRDVETAIDKGLACLSGMQSSDGGFADAEGCSQVICALTSLGIALDDARFVKNGSSCLDALLGYRLAGGGFSHIKGGEVNAMATEQALYAMAAAKRADDGESGIYRMDDEPRAQLLSTLKGMRSEEV